MSWRRTSALALTVLIGLLAAPAVAGAADVYVSPAGADGNPCSAASPCRSFDRGYRVAAPGQTVEVAGGTYPGQTIGVDGAKAAGPRVLIRPAAGAGVNVTGEVAVFGSNVEVAGMNVGSWYVKPGANQVTLRELEANGRGFITSASNISVIGGSLGPITNSGAVQVKAAEGSSVPPRNILFEGVDFHDFIRTQDGAHVDCLHVMAVDGMVLRGNTFRNCEAFDVLFTVLGSAGSPRNVLIENNFFSCCRSGYYSLQLGGGHGEQWQNFLIRNNSFDRSLNVSTGTTTSGSNVRIHSNVGDGPPQVLCSRPGVAWSHNVWSAGSRCGPGDISAASGWVNAAAIDFHLLPGSPARNRAHPTDYAPTDIDGQRRPQGGAADAGADEYADGYTPPGALPLGQPGAPTGSKPAAAGNAIGGVAGAGLRLTAPRGTSALTVGTARTAARWALRRVGLSARQARRARQTVVVYGELTEAAGRRVKISVDVRRGGRWKGVLLLRPRVSRGSGRYAVAVRLRATGVYRIRLGGRQVGFRRP